MTITPIIIYRIITLLTVPISASYSDTSSHRRWRCALRADKKTYSTHTRVFDGYGLLLTSPSMHVGVRILALALSPINLNDRPWLDTRVWDCGSGRGYTGRHPRADWCLIYDNLCHDVGGGG